MAITPATSKASGFQCGAGESPVDERAGPVHGDAGDPALVRVGGVPGEGAAEGRVRRLSAGGFGGGVDTVGGTQAVRAPVLGEPLLVAEVPDPDGPVLRARHDNVLVRAEAAEAGDGELVRRRSVEARIDRPEVASAGKDLILHRTGEAFQKVIRKVL